MVARMVRTGTGGRPRPAGGTSRRDVPPRARGDLAPALRGQLGHDALAASGRVAPHDDVVPEVQGAHSSQSLAPRRLERGGQQDPQRAVTMPPTMT